MLRELGHKLRKGMIWDIFRSCFMLKDIKVISYEKDSPEYN